MDSLQQHLFFLDNKYRKERFRKPRAEPNLFELCRGEKRCMNMNYNIQKKNLRVFYGWAKLNKARKKLAQKIDGVKAAEERLKMKIEQFKQNRT